MMKGANMDFLKAFDYENNFYLSSDVGRIGKLIAHYELYNKVAHLAGDIAEFGVFKGASLIRFASFVHLTGYSKAKKVYGFDTFGSFPETNYEDDKLKRQNFIDVAGEKSISKKELEKVLKHKGLDANTFLVEGDILETVPMFLENKPEVMFSLINLDTDVYEPAKVILEYFYPKLVRGGILILDDYGVFPGETKAVNDYFKDKDVVIQKLPFSSSPSFIIK